MICSIFHTSIVCSTAIIEEIAHRRQSTSGIAFYGILAHVDPVIGAQLVPPICILKVYLSVEFGASTSEATHMAQSCPLPFPQTGQYHLHPQGSCNCHCSIHSLNAAFSPFSILHNRTNIKHLRRSLRRPTKSALQLQSLSPGLPPSLLHSLTYQLLDHPSAPLFQHCPLAVLP